MSYKKLIDIINGAPDGVNYVQPSKCILGDYDYVRCGGIQLPTPKTIQDLDLVEGEEYLCVEGGELMTAGKAYEAVDLGGDIYLPSNTGGYLYLSDKLKFILLTPALKKEFGEVEQSEVASAMSFDHEQKVYTVEMQKRGELPEVGMMVQTSTGQFEVLLPIDDDFMTVIKVNGEYVIQAMDGVKPIDTRTPEEKAVDEMQGYVSHYDTAAKEILEAIKDNKIHGVKWVGE